MMTAPAARALDSGGPATNADYKRAAMDDLPRGPNGWALAPRAFSHRRPRSFNEKAEETRELLDSIDTSTVVGLRDRAIIAAMVYSFARVGEMITMRVEDYFVQGRRSWLRLHEKGGKHHEMPCHHSLEEYLDGYVKAAGIEEDKKVPSSARRRGSQPSPLAIR